MQNYTTIMGIIRMRQQGSLIPAMPRSLQGRKQYYHPAHDQIPGPSLILDRPGENGSPKGCPGVLSTG